MIHDSLSSEEVLKILTTPNSAARDRFVETFSSDLEDLAAALAAAYERFSKVNSRVPQDERSGWSQLFLYSAFDCLVSATQLLVFGHVLAAGNLMRAFSEATSMALLCACDQLDVFDRFKAAPEMFPVHSATDMLRRRKVAKALDVIPEGLDILAEINGHYSQHSHSSAWAASSRSMFREEGGLSLAGEFDPEKLDYYGRELRLRRSAADRFVEAVLAAESQLQSRHG